MVGNPEDRFSHNEAILMFSMSCLLFVWISGRIFATLHSCTRLTFGSPEVKIGLVKCGQLFQFLPICLMLLYVTQCMQRILLTTSGKLFLDVTAIK